MGRLNQLVAKLYDHKIDGIGLGLFRIVYSFVLLLEVLQITYFRHLIYDKVPFVNPSEINVLPGLLVWMVVLVMLMFGWKTRYVTILNYVLSLVFIATLRSYEYHVFYTYMIVNFLLIFSSCGQIMSFDRLLQQWKYSKLGHIYEPPDKVSVLNYFVIIGVSLGFVYFDSIFYKLASHNWMTGMGMWLPASLPHVTYLNTTFLLNFKWLILGLGYLTLLFEAVFIFTFFRKKWRVPLLVIGLGLHLGIVLEFPIPWFGLAVAGMYLLMVPVSWWSTLSRKLKFSEPRITFFYDEQCPLCLRTMLTLRFLDWLGALSFKGVQTEASLNPALAQLDQNVLLDQIHVVTASGRVVVGFQAYHLMMRFLPLMWVGYLLFWVPGIRQLGARCYQYIAGSRERAHCTLETCGFNTTDVFQNPDSIRLTGKLTLKTFKIGAILAGLLIFILLQINVTTHSLVIQKVRDLTGFTGSVLESKYDALSKPVWGVSKILFGITRHGVFMDGHFDGYNHVIAIEAKLEDGTKKWLPIIGPQGKAKWYNSSFNWVKWTFRVVGPNIKQDRLINGIRDFSTFWAVQNGYDLDHITFNIYLKKIRIPLAWEKDFLQRQLDKPWQLIGQGYWNQGVFVADLPKVEQL